jgi:class 3 adenylate cyclase/tetratricopeptide (TPR) repeat protein
MRCTKCGTENATGAKFCNQCATALSRACPKCDYLNAPDAKFCAECAEALSSGVSKSTARASSTAVRIAAERVDASALDGERKTVTALFADIKGSTELEQDLDPEEARAIVDPAIKLMIDAVRRYDGYIVQSTGDGIFALFGAPVAHEDHPQRALYAALRMQEEMKRYSAKVVADGGMPIEARIGANTGEVVVRSIATGSGHVEYTPIGHTTNLASRMQAVAPTGSIATSEQTRKLVEGYFQLKPMGPTKVKGVSEPINVYEVTGLGPLRTRLQRSAGRGFTKFVGREREMEAMKHAAEQAKAGNGQIVVAMADAGVGKSRLFYEFKAVAQSGWMVLEAFSASHGRASAYLPVAELLRGYFRIEIGDDERARREKVNGKVLTLDRGLEDALPYLYALVGIVRRDDSLAQMDAEIRKRRTLEAIKRIVLRESLSQPIMLIFEDLHWIDEETQSLLNLLADSIATARVLLLLNYRPEYSHRWGSKTFYTQLRLDPLGKESADQMLSSLVGVSPELLPLKRLIIEKTEGNPFFMEEMIQVLLDEGALVREEAPGTVAPNVRLTKPLRELKIPPTVQAILAARIDRLPHAEKDLLQTLAVLGNAFPLRLVQKMMDTGGRTAIGNHDDDLSSMLAKLQIAEFIYEQPGAGDVEYTFKHALTREVAYGTLLLERRRLLHERAGRSLETLYADSLDDHLADLGLHFQRAGKAMEAARYLRRAGILASAKSAFPEAIGHLTTGLELVKTLLPGVERDRAEWDLLTVLTVCLSVTSGAGSKQRGDALMRMSELSEQFGDDARLFYVVASRSDFHGVRDELHRERELSEQAVAIAEKSGNSSYLENACNRLGYSFWKLGDFSAASKQLERAIAAPTVAHHRAGLASAHYKMLAMANLAWVRWILGFPDQASKIANDAIGLVRNETPGSSLAFGLIYAAEFHRFLRDGHGCEVLSREALEISSRLGFSLLEAQARFELGWSLVRGNQVATGLTEMNRAMDALSATGAVASTWRAAPLAEAWARTGDPRRGLALLNDALARLTQTGERFYEAELKRLVGELTLADHQSKTNEARRAFEEAIELARLQGARSLELRATVSLARLLDTLGHRKEARAMLADIYGWFSEGFDTADLKDAKALLDQLNA